MGYPKSLVWLATTYAGIFKNDAFLLIIYHQVIKMSKKGWKIKKRRLVSSDFACTLANQVVQYVNKMGSSNVSRFLSEDD
jgi:hypothetical protein